MTFLALFSSPSFQTAGPAARVAVTLLTTALLARPNRSRPVAPALVRRRLGLPQDVARWRVVGVLTVAALLAVGIDLQGLWSTLVPILSLVALGGVAMWSILSPMLAPVLIVVFRPFEVGHRVEFLGDDPVQGKVTALNPVYTTLRGEDGGTLQVPNHLFFQKALKRHGPVALARARPSLA